MLYSVVLVFAIQRLAPALSFIVIIIVIINHPDKDMSITLSVGRGAWKAMGGRRFPGKHKENDTQEVTAVQGTGGSCGHHLTEPSAASELPPRHVGLAGDPGPAAECHFP